MPVAYLENPRENIRMSDTAELYVHQTLSVQKVLIAFMSKESLESTPDSQKQRNHNFLNQ